MRTVLTLALIAMLSVTQLAAQRCFTVAYQQAEMKKDPSLAMAINGIETFTRQQANNSTFNTSRVDALDIVKIPVVVHILYHYASENVTDAQVKSQIDALNIAYRRRNADTTNTPDRFKPFAADCEIEFQLAISDPKRTYTTGIVRKYTPVTRWVADDKMKFSAETGDDAWDPSSYLNIWVCTVDQVAGYSSVMGGPSAKDGLVINNNAFGTIGMSGGFNMGKTAVHEAGHWLNLKHLWGDEDCGDDNVDDTPKQSGYNAGCPSGIRVTCGNGPNGDMYMDYMDFTSDACMNMFTIGQKIRMKALFATGGVRNSIRNSKGLSTPLIFQTPLPADEPKWLHAQLYPNPASAQLTLDLAYDIRWIGKTINVTNLQGQTVMMVKITSKIQVIDLTRLQAGMYFMTAKKEDGDFIKEKFIKL